MNLIFWQIIVGVVLIFVGAGVQMWILRRSDVSQKIEELRKNQEALQGQVRYIQGRLNGKQREEMT